MDGVFNHVEDEEFQYWLLRNRIVSSSRPSGPLLLDLLIGSVTFCRKWESNQQPQASLWMTAKSAEITGKFGKSPCVDASR